MLQFGLLAPLFLQMLAAVSAGHGGGCRGPSSDGFETLGENMEEPGLTLNASTVVSICTKDSPFGAKLSAAVAACNNDERVAFAGQFIRAELNLISQMGEEEAEMTDRRRGRGPGRRPRCMTGSALIDKLNQEVSAFHCIYSSLGWVDAAGEPQDAVFEADIASLPAVVGSVLTEDNIKTCASQTEQGLLDNKKIAKCFNTYTEDEQSQIQTLVDALADAVCFDQLLDMICAEFVFMSYIQPVIP